MVSIFQWFFNLIFLLYTFIFKRKNLRVAFSLLKIGNEIAKYTKTDLDNAALAALATFLRNETKGLTDEEVKALSDEINNVKRGKLKEVTISVDSKKGIQLGTGFGSVSYNHNNGSIKWEKGFSL